MDEKTKGELRTEVGTAGGSRAQPGIAGHSRPDPTTEKVSVGETLLLFEDAGLPRNRRSIRRYCTEGAMSCFKVDTDHGRQWMVDRQSAEKYIIQLQQAHKLSQRTEVGTAGGSRAQPGTAGYVRPPADHQKPSQEVEFLRDQIIKKDTQLEKKDEQIQALLERDRETNHLIKGLQNLLMLQAPSTNRKPGTAGDSREQPDTETEREGGQPEDTSRA